MAQCGDSPASSGRPSPITPLPVSPRRSCCSSWPSTGPGSACWCSPSTTAGPRRPGWSRWPSWFPASSWPRRWPRSPTAGRRPSCWWAAMWRRGWAWPGWPSRCGPAPRPCRVRPGRGGLHGDHGHPARAVLHAPGAGPGRAAARGGQRGGRLGGEHAGWSSPPSSPRCSSASGRSACCSRSAPGSSPRPPFSWRPCGYRGSPWPARATRPARTRYSKASGRSPGIPGPASWSAC